MLVSRATGICLGTNRRFFVASTPDLIKSINSHHCQPASFPRVSMEDPGNRIDSHQESLMGLIGSSFCKIPAVKYRGSCPNSRHTRGAKKVSF